RIAVSPCRSFLRILAAALCSQWPTGRGLARRGRRDLRRRCGRLRWLTGWLGRRGGDLCPRGRNLKQQPGGWVQIIGDCLANLLRSHIQIILQIGIEEFRVAVVKRELSNLLRTK